MILFLKDAFNDVDLGVDRTSITSSPQDTTKRSKVEQNATPSMFTLALTVESTEFSSVDTLSGQELYKSTLESRPVSSDSDSSKKRSFSNIIDPPKFRMSRKKARQNPPDTIISQDYILFDAVREPIVTRASDGIPEIRSSGIPNEIQSGDVRKDAVFSEMLKSYLNVDHDNRTYLNLKDEYVYDIYYKSALSPDTAPRDANFGVLVYESEPELIEDEEAEDEEDPDSNSEGYYQNSYPDEDEWAGAGWGSDEEEDEYGRRHSRKIPFDSDEEIGSDSEDDRYSYPETEEL